MFRPGVLRPTTAAPPAWGGLHTTTPVPGPPSPPARLLPRSGLQHGSTASHGAYTRPSLQCLTLCTSPPSSLCPASVFSSAAMRALPERLAYSCHSLKDWQAQGCCPCPGHLITARLLFSARQTHSLKHTKVPPSCSGHRWEGQSQDPRNRQV